MRSSQSSEIPPGAGRGLLWFSAAIAAFLAVRAGTTLAAGASFATPGDGWRSVWQLAIVAVLVAGLAVPRLRVMAVAVVGATYAGASVLELFHAADLFGVIPVDMRDRIVHPLVALLALAAIAAARPGRVGRTSVIAG